MLKVLMGNLHVLSVSTFFKNIYLHYLFHNKNSLKNIFCCLFTIFVVLLLAGLYFKELLSFNPVCIYTNTKIFLSRDHFSAFENVTLPLTAIKTLL